MFIPEKKAAPSIGLYDPVHYMLWSGKMPTHLVVFLLYKARFFC